MLVAEYTRNEILEGNWYLCCQNVLGGHLGVFGWMVLLQQRRGHPDNCEKMLSAFKFYVMPFVNIFYAVISGSLLE